jgi:predicted DsbA family dithiol-disulfide isomerase
LVDALRKEFHLEDTWVDIEIHPETPAEGVSLAERFAGRDVSAMYAALTRRAAEYGLEMNQVARLSNSRLATAAGEYARDHDSYPEFSKAVFDAYFARGEDIGDVDVLARCAVAAGLDADDLRAALSDDRYAARLDAAMREAAAAGVSGVPTFIIGGRERVVGAQPLEVLREAMRRAQERA